MKNLDNNLHRRAAERLRRNRFFVFSDRQTLLLSTVSEEKARVSRNFHRRPDQRFRFHLSSISRYPFRDPSCGTARISSYDDNDIAKRKRANVRTLLRCR